MPCPRCRHENPPRAKFCLECGQRLAPACAACGTELPETGEVLPRVRPRRRRQRDAGPRRRRRPRADGRTPATYTPRHLAERILTSRSALEGERKPVTVLFCDLVGSTALAERLGAGGHARPRQRVLRDRPRRGAPLRGHGQPVPRRRVHGALRRAARPRGSRAPRGARRARRRPRAPRPARRRRAGTEDVALDRPHGASHRLRGRGRDRRQPAHGLHGGRRHDPPGGPPPADSPSRARSWSSEATWRLVEGYVRGERVGPVAGAGPERAGRRRSASSAWARAARRSRATGRAGSATSSAATGSSRPCWTSSPPSRRAGARPSGSSASPASGSRGSCSSSATASADRRVTYLQGRCLSYGAAIPYVPVRGHRARAACGIGEADPPEAMAEKVRRALRGRHGPRRRAALPRAPPRRAGGERRRSTPSTPEVIKARTFETLRQMCAAREPAAAARPRDRGSPLDRPDVGGVPHVPRREPGRGARSC